MNSILSAQEIFSGTFFKGNKSIMINFLLLIFLFIYIEQWVSEKVKVAYKLFPQIKEGGGGGSCCAYSTFLNS